MDRLDQLIDRRAPLSLECLAADVARRFAAEPEAIVLAVVAGEQPVGLVNRLAFEALDPAPQTPVQVFMDEYPAIEAGHTTLSTFRDRMLAEGASGPSRGFIVTSAGRYLGVGTPLTLLAAGDGRARGRRAASIALTQRLADEVVRQIGGAETFIDSLARQPLAPDAKLCVQTLTDCFADIHRLTRRAAALHAEQSGLSEPAPRHTLLRDVMDGLEQRWRDRAQHAGITLMTAYDGSPDLAADIDADRLADLFDALVERALSETRRGAVEATLMARPALDGLTLEGRVRDGGPPIPPARLARIFDPLDGGSSFSIGLGMAYAASIASAMNGVIRAESNAGSGASVIFEMIAPEAVSEGPVAESSMMPTTAHILIVDDNATNRMVAEALCEMFDCTSEQAVDGIEAVEAASTRAFDLILMDIKMPRMDGVAATRAIRAMAGPGGRIPIIALTANADPSDVRAYIDAGMNDVVEKPIKAERLLTVLDKVLNGVTPRGSAAA
jgi:CheY-like chemotaxis protein